MKNEQLIIRADFTLLNYFCLREILLKMKGLKSVVLLVVVITCTTSARPSTNEGKRLIKRSETEPAAWLNQDEVFSLMERNIGFMDITGHTFPERKSDTTSKKALPSTLRYGTKVRDIIAKLDTTRMESFIREYSSYNNRYYESDTGVAAAEWLLVEVDQTIRPYTSTRNVSVKAISHSWRQQSVIARIDGSDPQLGSEVLVLGAHLDSVASGGSPASANAPGADDNASGSVVVLETLRLLLESEFVPKRSIEFHWYAAEEVGLRGALDIAESYYNQGINVISMTNFDTVGYYVEGRNEIAIVTDNTDSSLNAFLRTLVDGYLDFGWFDYRCNYGCSDHAAWNEYLYQSAFPKEAVGHPLMHSNGDLLASLSFTQISEFVKLAIGYSIEIAEPN